MKTLKVTFAVLVFVITLFSAESNALAAGTNSVTAVTVESIKIRPGYIWVEGHYKLNRFGRLVWMPGHWKRI